MKYNEVLVVVVIVVVVVGVIIIIIIIVVVVVGNSRKIKSVGLAVERLKQVNARKTFYYTNVKVRTSSNEERKREDNRLC